MKIEACVSWTVKVACSALLLFVFGLQQISADEPAQAFLKGLQEIGYFDVALDYLDQAKDDPYVSDEFKQQIDYLRATTLIASTRGSRDADFTGKRLDEAQLLLESYAKSNQTIKSRARALQYAGVLYSSRADLIFQKSTSDRLTVVEREQLMVEARGFLEKATVNVSESKRLISRLVDPNSPDYLRIDPDKPSTRDELEDMRRAYTLVTRMLPALIERTGDTYPESDSKRIELYTEAIEFYDKIWDKYRQKYSAGIQARVDAARCYKKIGKPEKALDHLSDVFVLGNSGVLKQIKKEAYFLATDCWNQVQPYPYKDVIFALETPVQGLGRTELRDQEWLKIQLELAIAKHESAKEIAASKEPQANSKAKSVDRAAAKLLRNVARIPNPLRDRAKKLLSEWDVPLVSATEESVTIATFQDALQAARDNIAELESSASEYNQIKRQVATTTDEATKEQLSSEAQPLKEQIDQLANKTLALLDQAMSYVDKDTPTDEINNVRYLQAFSYFASERHLETVAIGDFLLTHYPTQSAAKQSANYTIQSLSILLENARDDGLAEFGMLKSKCDQVLDLYPGSNEAGLAGTKLCKVSLRDKNHVASRAYFDKIPGNYPGRERLGLRLGQLMWIDYKRKIRAKAEPASIKKQLDDAIQYMEESAKSINADGITYDTAVGGLMLVDAKLRINDVESATRYLESESATVLAPLELVKLQHPSISSGTNAEIFRQEAYKIAIKTYLAAMRSDPGNRQKWVDKASGIIDHMKQLVAESQDPNARKRVTAIYQLMASELRQGFEEISDTNEKLAYAKSLQEFLISIQKSSSDTMELIWAGTTMYNVADALDKSGNLAASMPMMREAVTTLDRAEQEANKSDPKDLSILIQLTRYRALARRGAGDYKKAVDEFVDLLSKHKVPVSYQIDAAQTLQEWGIRKKDSNALALASGGTGSYTDPKTGKKSKAIWGWVQMHTATASNPKYRDVFFTALYGIAEGRYEYGKLKKSKKAISAGLNVLVKERNKNPDFSGMALWKKRFDALERKIRSSR